MATDHPLPVGHVATVLFMGQAMAVEIMRPMPGRPHDYRVRVPYAHRWRWGYRDPVWSIPL